MIYRESKVYFDGSHFIGIPHTTRPSVRRRKPKEELIEVVPQEQQVSPDENSTAENASDTANPATDTDSEKGVTAEQTEYVGDDDVFEEWVEYVTAETAPFPLEFKNIENNAETQKPINPNAVQMTRKELFDKLYAETAGKPRKERKSTIFNAMRPYFDTNTATQLFVDANFDRKSKNMIARKIRIIRKANLQDFNYFCTTTYFYGQF